MIERIQIFTRGCVRSIAVEKNLRKAVSKMGLDVEVEAYADPAVHRAEGLESFPSVKINGELRVDGDFTSVGAFEEMLSEFKIDILPFKMIKATRFQVKFGAKR